MMTTARMLTLLLLLALCAQPMEASSPSSVMKSSLSVTLQDSLNKVFSRRWNKARDMVLQEQLVEDYNGDYIATAGSMAQACRHRRLIALPLTDAFDPPMGVFSHEHVQTGDKMSLPQNFWTAIQFNKAEVPWLFSVSRIPETKDDQQSTTSTSTSMTEKDDDDDASTQTTALATSPRVEFCETSDITFHIPAAQASLNKVVGGPLDFRSPTSYVFVPWWMMRALGIRPGDVVQVDLITNVAAGSLAKLRPHSAQFAKDISNPQAVLETELRHYSSLVKGSTIAMDYNGHRYWFDVVDCKSAPKGESCPYIKVQDCDIATDFLTNREALQEMARKKKQKMQEAAMEA